MNHPVPPQPDESTWRFVEDLQTPLWTAHHWPRREARGDEVSLAQGVTIRAEFEDAAGSLATAYDDLKRFFQAGQVPLQGGFEIVARFARTEIYEAFRIEVSDGHCLLLAADSEGIRRAIYCLEDEMLHASGPFLKKGVIEKKPVVRTRISRCFFGPVNRPPKNRDELADDTDYYPDEYLNRLAYDGVNALWLSVDWKDLCRTAYFPEQGKDAEKRFAKLRRTVEKCARYGIKIYIFGIEPRALDHAPHFELFPELRGHENTDLAYFCTSTEIGQRYIEEALFTIFDAVPGLGGYINISLGERGTHCYSEMTALGNNNCPRCSQRQTWEVCAEALTLMARGMQRANPSAELVSWMYLPYWPEEPEFDVEVCKENVRQIAAHVPPNVTLQVNFESSAISTQYGKDHTMCDYSLAFVGPSPLFADCAANATAAGARMSAKLQVGCSHEVATVPFVPVPGNLYRKYRAIHELGVSTVMQCWYFGNYPSPMTKAAGLLSFAPFPATEDEFLLQLAALSWGDDAPAVAQAWKYFREAYGAFPSALSFAWFGPVHDCISWPLHLIPVDLPIAPSWKLLFPPSGDRVAECFANEFTLKEILQTCRFMAETWQQGIDILQEIKPRYAGREETGLEIGVAEALGLQLHSAANIMRFYALREALPYHGAEEQLQALNAMAALVEQEIANTRQLIPLAEKDSRLGFHSEAEGYKYFPAKFEWRIQQLQDLLRNDFPEVERQIRAGEPLFAEFTGALPTGPAYHCLQVQPGEEIDWNDCAALACESADGELDAVSWKATWQAATDSKNVFVRVQCETPQNVTLHGESPFLSNEYVALRIEPRRLWPSQRYLVNPEGQTHQEIKSTLPMGEWSAAAHRTNDGWEAVFTLPLAILRENVPANRPLRINVERFLPGQGTLRWIAVNPLPERLIFGDDNSADYGWLLLQNDWVKTN